MLHAVKCRLSSLERSLYRCPTSAISGFFHTFYFSPLYPSIHHPSICPGWLSSSLSLQPMLAPRFNQSDYGSRCNLRPDYYNATAKYPLSFFAMVTLYYKLMTLHFGLTSMMEDDEDILWGIKKINHNNIFSF